MKSVLIIGLGRFGRHMASRMIRAGHSVMAIDASDERANAAVPFIPNIQIADTTDENVIASLGVNNFDLCVVAIGDNFQASLETTVLLKDHGAKVIVARATKEVYRKLLLRNGADHVVYAEKEAAERLAVAYGSDHIFDYIALSKDVGIYEIDVPAGWIGKTVKEAAVRAVHNINIIATRENGEIMPMLKADHVFTKNQRLLVMGNGAQIQKLTK